MTFSFIHIISQITPICFAESRVGKLCAIPQLCYLVVIVFRSVMLCSGVLCCGVLWCACGVLVVRTVCIVCPVLYALSVLCSVCVVFRPNGVPLRLCLFDNFIVRYILLPVCDFLHRCRMK